MLEGGGKPYETLYMIVCVCSSSLDENGCCPRTVKYLQGVAAGTWVVGFQCKTILHLVEPPNKGHLGTRASVLYSEVSFIRRLEMY